MHFYNAKKKTLIYRHYKFHIVHYSSIHNKASHFLIVVDLVLLRLPQDGGEDAAPVRVLMKADPASRESLQAEADIDPMDGEQTWPTESELLEAEGAEKRLVTTEKPFCLCSD